MAYLEQDNDNLIQDLITRKEFYWNRRWNVSKPNIYKEIIPRFLLEDAIIRNGNLKLLSYQMFVKNYMSPNTPYKRLYLQWMTGSGKSIGTLSIAMNFIEHYRLEKEMGNIEIGSVFIIGFSERVFKNELLRFPEFGFLSREERIKLDKLKRLAAYGGKPDIEKYQDMVTKIKKRFSNRKGNGFFKFYGYKAFVNRIFVADKSINLNELTEAQIRTALSQGKITYDEELMLQFKNSLIICDEIHNVYNSVEKNNWGIAIQAVLDREPTCRAVFTSATPLNNSPTEIVDLLNLLLPSDMRLTKSDFFNTERELKSNALERIGELSYGRVSFLSDVNPKYYPAIISKGEMLKDIPYLKFIRCPMSKFHYATYKAVYNGTLSQDSQYLVDFALENPDPNEKLGLYQTQQIKTALHNASQKWKDKHGLDYRDGKIVGDALKKENLVRYSSKYVEMLNIIMNTIKNKSGKIFIYHNIVHMSGVLFIEQVLLKNGFLDEFGSSNDHTICMKCGKIRKEHNRDEILGANEEDTANELDTSKHTQYFDMNSLDPIDANQKLAGDIYDKIDPKDSITLHKKKSGYYWKHGEHYLMNIVIRKKPYEHYYIAASGLDNCLVNGRSRALKDFSYILNTLINDDPKPIIVQVPIYAPRFGEWLLHVHFKIANQTSKYILMKWVKPTHNTLELASTPTDVCGVVEGSGKKIRVIPRRKNKNRSKIDHKFTPVRFVIAHSEVDKAVMEHSIEKFNNPDNADGNRFMILVGSKIIKEAWNFKAIQNEIIVGRPDNISTLLQIRGRAVRKHSHKDLPEENRVVNIYILTSCLPEKQITGPDKGKWKLSYEEEKYKEKILSFQVMQKIEKVLHENAIDAYVNHDLIRTAFETDDPLAMLPYEPAVKPKNNREMNVSELNLSTFNIYHSKKEVETIKIIIKRLFIELSSTWEYSDLFEAVKNPPDYETELNTHLFTEDNFIIALDQLSWNNDEAYIEPLISKSHISDANESIHASLEGGEYESLRWFGEGDRIDSVSYLDEEDSAPDTVKSDAIMRDIFGGSASAESSQPRTNYPNYIIDRLYDVNDKIITLPGGQDSIIVPIPDGKKQFYILFPINYETNEPNIDIELPYRVMKQESVQVINMNSFVQNKRTDFDYDDKKRIYYRKYIDISIENLQNAICEYGNLFHMKFVEECIEYVFNCWTDPKFEMTEYHEFYFKMLYYYDLHSLIMWQFSAKPAVSKQYSKYAIPVKAKDIKLKVLSRYENRKEEIEDISPPDDSDLANSTLINLLKNTYNRTSNVWIPREFREHFDEIVASSLKLFSGRKKRAKGITKARGDLLPIGHFISKFPRIYHPDTGFREDPVYKQSDTTWTENSTIIGYDSKSSTGVHIRFKLRAPIHDIKRHKDSRKLQKGVVCKSKSKTDLRQLAKKLDIMLPEKQNVEDLCVLIRAKLIRLELKERIKKSKIKYFYFSHEEQPGIE